MRTGRRFFVFLSVLVVLALPGTANAGGWWSYLQLDRENVVAGETILGTDQVWFPAIEQAERLTDPTTTTPYHVYLVPGFDPLSIELSRPDPYDWIDLGSAPRYLVGEVRFGARDANLVRIRARITIPTWLEAGEYSLLVCDTGCERPLGSVIAVGITVWADPSSARMANQLTELRMLLNQRRAALYQARGATRRAEAAVTKLEAEIAALESQVATLEAQLTDMATVLSTPAPVPQREPDGLRWWTAAVWFLVGAGIGAGALALVLRRRRRTAEPPVDAWREADRAMRGENG